MSRNVGIFQILIGCGIFSAAVGMYFTDCDIRHDDRTCDIIKSICRMEEIRQQNDRDMQGIITVQKKIVGTAVQGVTLAAKGLDSIVSLKDYTVMKTKPFACVGDAFSGIQKDMHQCVKETAKLENDLDSIQKRVDHQMEALQELQKLLKENNKAVQQQRSGRTILLAVLALTGIGFVASGCSIYGHSMNNKQTEEK